MTTPEKQKEFLDKLQNLLAEYNASIGWTCGFGSDTHGIYDDVVYIDIGDKIIFEAAYIDASKLEQR